MNGIVTGRNPDYVRFPVRLRIPASLPELMRLLGAMKVGG